MFVELALRSPHLLVLDEPTNHLDVESIDALADALKAFNGAFILVSHDVRLVSEVCDQLWIMPGNRTLTVASEPFEDYKAR